MISDSKYSKIYWAILGLSFFVAIIVLFHTNLFLIALPLLAIALVLMLIDIYFIFVDRFIDENKLLKNLFSISYFLFILLCIMCFISCYIQIEIKGIFGIIFPILIIIVILLFVITLIYVDLKYTFSSKEKREEIINARNERKITEQKNLNKK